MDSLNTRRCSIHLNDICYKIYNRDGKIAKQEEENFNCQHEEADSRMVFHLSRLPPEITKIVIKASDTDVLIILLGNFHLFRDILVWIETGT